MEVRSWRSSLAMFEGRRGGGEEGEDEGRSRACALIASRWIRIRRTREHAEASLEEEREARGDVEEGASSSEARCTRCSIVPESTCTA